jgi:hypothetical protein
VGVLVGGFVHWLVRGCWIGGSVGRMVDGLVGRLVSCLIGWVGGLVACLVGGLFGCVGAEVLWIGSLGG